MTAQATGLSVTGQFAMRAQAESMAAPQVQSVAAPSTADLPPPSSAPAPVSAAFESDEIVAPGDDGVSPELAGADEDPGYCDIWEADLLDPPDVLDELEESIAFFAVPPFRLSFHSGSVPPLLSVLVTTPPAAFFKPPISLA